MKMMQVPIDEEILHSLRFQAFAQGTTLKVLVPQIIQNYLANIHKPEPILAPTTPTTPTILIKKTHKIGKPLTQMKQYNLKGFTWMLLEGYRPHFDSDGNPIPLRFTDENNNLVDLNEDDIKELEEHFAAKVEIER